ncbi:Site-specific DNA recombinase [Paenibacillus sp. yr247]|uniref:recombinase family protein n=1 Tax=Paenibacillus sp. yr247 TaxID=1761880 RepID=UPI00087E38E7|nr:recombinase family protein [Paenibacillus sp. yr247]SDP07213.1 Site-specific DNA recombinase [Paenibacillus sp. yr247]
MIIGYARVSTADQNLDMQIEAIEKYAKARGEQRLEIYKEKESGGKVNRKELDNALSRVREGDTFVVFKLDRLARSTQQLFKLHEDIEKWGCHFVSLNDNIDTSTAAGKAMFGMIAVFAEFERNLIVERTKAGLESARKKGKIGGRPALTESKKRTILSLYNSGISATDIAKEQKIGRSTIYKIINEVKE